MFSIVAMGRQVLMPLLVTVYWGAERQDHESPRIGARDSTSIEVTEEALRKRAGEDVEDGFFVDQV